MPLSHSSSVISASFTRGRNAPVGAMSPAIGIPFAMSSTIDESTYPFRFTSECKNGMFIFLSGDSDGKALAHRPRRGSILATTSRKVNMARRRRSRKAAGSRASEEITALAFPGTPAFASVASGDTAQATSHAPPVCVCGSPTIKDGRARPVGCRPVTPAAAYAARSRPRLGTNGWANPLRMAFPLGGGFFPCDIRF